MTQCNCKDPIFSKTLLDNPNLKKQIKRLKKEKITDCCFDFLDESYLYSYIVYGQSNATGVVLLSDIISNFDNRAISNNKKLQWNDGRTELEVVDNTCALADNHNDRITEVEVWGHYNPAVVGANQLSSLLKGRKKKTIQFITMNTAWNGASIYNITPLNPRWLTKDSEAYQNMITAIRAAKAYADSIGKKFMVPFVVFHQGETNVIYYTPTGITTDIYRGYLEQIANDFYADVAEITGQSWFPRWYVVQENYLIDPAAQSPEGNMVIKMAQYFDNSSEDFVSVFPAYPLSTLTGFGHYDATSLMRWSLTSAKNIFQNLYNNRKYSFVVNNIVKPDSKSVLLTFDVPAPPIQFDLSRGITPNNGFHILDLSNNDIPITSVEIVRKDQILIKTNTVLTTGFVAYQYEPAIIVPPINYDLRPGSSVSDSDTYQSLIKTQLKNYLISFKLPLPQ